MSSFGRTNIEVCFYFVSPSCKEGGFFCLFLDLGEGVHPSNDYTRVAGYTQRQKNVSILCGEYLAHLTMYGAVTVSLPNCYILAVTGSLHKFSLRGRTEPSQITVSQKRPIFRTFLEAVAG